MRLRFRSALLIASLISATACVTSQSRYETPRVPMEKPLEKEGQKVPDSVVAGSPAGEVPGQTAVDLQALWTRVNNPQVPLNEDDLMRATQLYPTQPQSLEEAIFVVTQMRILQKDWERKTSFQTQDLHTNQKADNTAGLSLEKTFQDLELDLGTILRANPSLKNRDSLMLTKELLSHTKNSAAFSGNVSAALREVGAEWPEVLAAAEPPAALPPPESPASPEASGAPAAPSPTDGSAAIDLMGSDTLLIAAQKLADKGDFKAAIEHTKRIKSDDPFYPQALEKQKQFSNRAVKDLRQKAAEAYSNATPINDVKAKINYLKQAKNFLDQALRDFPGADQLDRVRDNLEAVNRDLELYDKSGT